MPTISSMYYRVEYDENLIGDAHDEKRVTPEIVQQAYGHIDFSITVTGTKDGKEVTETEKIEFSSGDYEEDVRNFWLFIQQLGIMAGVPVEEQTAEWREGLPMSCSSSYGWWITYTEGVYVHGEIGEIA